VCVGLGTLTEPKHLSHFVRPRGLKPAARWGSVKAPYYVEWRLRQAWAQLLFQDEELTEGRAKRDPAAPAEPSAPAKRNKTERQTARGLPVHSFETLLEHPAQRSRHTCRLKSEPAGPTFDQLTEHTPLQARAMELVGLLPVRGKHSVT